jgi:NADPH:quinone reductase-like Zn-dependent oxidoreductase
MRLTNDVGVDLVVECVGGSVLQKSISGSKRGGMVVTCGAHAGEQIELDVIELFRKHLRFQGSVLATRSEMAHALGLIADGKLKPVIHSIMPLERAAEAAEVIAQRASFGNIVMIP